MSTTPSNTLELLPQNRYEDNVQHYQLDGPTGQEIRLVRDDGGRLVSIPELGISAGAVKLDHVHLGFHGSMFVRAWALTHRPTQGTDGVIEIHTIFED